MARTLVEIADLKIVQLSHSLLIARGEQLFRNMLHSGYELRIPFILDLRLRVTERSQLRHLRSLSASPLPRHKKKIRLESSFLTY